LDEHRNALTGFAVNVAKTKRTRIIQRRVLTNKVIKANLGSISDDYKLALSRWITKSRFLPKH
jgi:hypothetical protein